MSSRFGVHDNLRKNETATVMHYLFLLFLLFISNCVWAQTLTWGERRSSTEIIVSDLKWTSSALMPKNLRSDPVVKRWMSRFAAEPDQFAEIDIDNNERTREILIADGDFPSGGRAFLLLSQTSSSNWVELLGFRGAPIFTGLNRPGKSMDLQVYSRDAGDMWVSYFKRKTDKYFYKGDQYVPRIFSTKCSHLLWQQLNLLKIARKNECDGGCSESCVNGG